MKLTCEQFVKLINNDIEFHKTIDSLEEVIGLSIYESTIHKYYWTTFETLLETFFNEDGLELIYWWLYEDVDKTIYDSNDKPITKLETPEDLYNYLTSTTTYTYLNVE